MKAASIEVETFEKWQGQLHIYPRGTRRTKAAWAIWINPDGSGTLFKGQEQILLPKNEPSQ